jgi:ATP-binding cassette, subfamily B, bacterial PglK
MIKYLSKFLYVLSESRGTLILLVGIFVSTSLLEVVGVSLIAPFLWLASHPESIQTIPFLSGLYQRLGRPSSDQLILGLGLGLVLLFCVKSYLSFSARAYIYRFSFTSQGLLISRLLKAYLSAPYTFYLSRDTASLIKNIIVETQTFCHMGMLPLLEATSNVIAIFCLMVLLAKTDLVLLTLIASIIFFAFLLFYSLRQKSSHWGREQSHAYHEMIRTINHGLGGIKETYVIGCQPYFENYMGQQVERYATNISKLQSFQILPRIILETLLIVFLVLIITVYQVVLKQDMDHLIAVLSIFAVAAIRLMPAVSQSLAAISQLQAGSYAVDMLYADLKGIQQQTEGLRSHSVPGPTGEIRAEKMKFVDRIDLNQVTYTYPNAVKKSLNNVSLTIQKGESIAFIGRSGAGKTTLVDVVLGLLEASEGDIQVDRRSIYSNLRAWQNLIGYIPQSIFLMDDTVERNIAFGVPAGEVDGEKLERAIELAQLSELMGQMPDGIKTAVGERGVRLSGGQRQRIGIARALYHEREILVLDEATAALDNETEHLITEAVRSLSGMKTVIIIAHRLSTVQHCQRIYLMEDGRIAKAGTYDEVVALAPVRSS